jgi:hypothetical protein
LQVSPLASYINGANLRADENWPKKNMYSTEGMKACSVENTFKLIGKKFTSDLPLKTFLAHFYLF